MSKKRKYFTKDQKRLAHNEQQRKCSHNWYSKNKDKVLARSKINGRTSKSRYVRLCYISKKKGREIDISFSQYEELLLGLCFYCGGGLPKYGGGLDRIDSNIGYVLSNVKPCCDRCNKAKNNMKTHEFRTWVLSVFNNWAAS